MSCCWDLSPLGPPPQCTGKWGGLDASLRSALSWATTGKCLFCSEASVSCTLRESIPSLGTSAPESCRVYWVEHCIFPEWQYNIFQFRLTIKTHVLMMEWEEQFAQKSLS